MLHDGLKQQIAFFCREFFAVIQPGGDMLGVQDHGRCKNRTGQRATAHFINTGYMAAALRMECLFKLKCW